MKWAKAIRRKPGAAWHIAHYGGSAARCDHRIALSRHPIDMSDNPDGYRCARCVALNSGDEARKS